MRVRGGAGVFAVLLAITAAAAQQNASARNPTTSAAGAGHTLLLVELDGFRWDYAVRDGARNLLAMGSAGAWAPEGMLPAYPAMAWPSQYTMVTGLYPGEHGIVADSFFDPARQARFSAGDAKIAADGSWYGGVPLWALAQRQGMRAACIGWAGCTAQIAGARPAYMGRGGAQPEAEVRQILAWLRMRGAERPQLITARFGEPGATARRFGPDAAETRAAVRRMDAEIGKLKAGVDATHLSVNLVVVSDRGLAKPDGGWIPLDRFADLSGFDTEGTLLYGKTEADRERVYNQLKKATSEFFVYRLKNVPAALHDRNARSGDPVIVATGAYAIRAHAASGAPEPPPAVDGFDARIVPEMKGIFFAAGPDIVKGRTVAPFENVNLYPWLAHLLGVTPAKNDGSANILSGILRDNGDTNH